MDSLSSPGAKPRGILCSRQHLLTSQQVHQPYDKRRAKLVADYTDILEELNLPDVAQPKHDQVSGQPNQARSLRETPEEQENEEAEELDAGEAALLAHLSVDPLHVDDLCRLSGLPIASVTSMLALLELKGKVEQVGSMHYVKASPELVQGREVTHGS